MKFILFLSTVVPLYIVQTEDNTIHFIFDTYIDSIKISKLKNTVPALPDDFVVKDLTIQPSMRGYIDNIKVSRNGFIHLDGFSLSIESLLLEPKIYNGVIFQTQRRCETIVKHDVILFLIFVDLKIIDSKSLYTRIESFNYIYYPFNRSKNIWVLGPYFRVEDMEYKFDGDIVAVYDTLDYNGATYMNRIWINTEINVYRPIYKAKENSYKCLLLIVPVFLIYFLRPKKVKLITKEYENVKYAVYSGIYNNVPVIIKTYKKRDPHTYKEISLLNKIDCISVKKILYHENNIFGPFIVFEHSEKCQNPTKENLLDLVNTIYYLSEQGFYYRNYNPVNIRTKNTKLVLFNVFSQEDFFNLGWYTDKAGDSESTREIISLGILLHYFITGYHPYDINTDTENRFVYTKNKDIEDLINKIECPNNKHPKKYTTKELLQIESNIINRKYLIRTESSLEHDLIYHTIKNSTTIRKLSKHPYFWSEERIFNFLANYSDVLEGSSSQCRRLERNRGRIFENQWNSYLDDTVKDELEVFRFYNYNNAKDLIRVIRNKGRHYNQIPDVVKEIYVSFPNGFVNYWMKTFPHLLIICYNCGESLKDNELLKDFY
ncbi:hypothetical protein P3W45_000924 [Vairimorpha bombi]|jgi:hypothetical protein